VKLAKRLAFAVSQSLAKKDVKVDVAKSRGLGEATAP